MCKKAVLVTPTAPKEPSLFVLLQAPIVAFWDSVKLSGSNFTIIYWFSCPIARVIFVKIPKVGIPQKIGSTGNSPEIGTNFSS